MKPSPGTVALLAMAQQWGLLPIPKPKEKNCGACVYNRLNGKCQCTSSENFDQIVDTEKVCEKFVRDK
jgi:hypothetical protein